ncbi:two-component system, OmpR family, sensor histidine kinase KdpD [Izhakiella capsodis]|uniref:histidine kinase n=1 Tax=Izhakiella capsodis TaxID=1367852 RepID=A0A1I4YSW2_9GAMM|nr:two-component system sensor histidine kinase KdpD [Izhakiella capsodis]SFN41104.1 two-component system, OmpR family, sensor histidine kinase KdpD [Izhakiella capsodis]
MNNDIIRPDPDALLKHAEEKPRGRLKIFFGANAGVGKTWSMLQEAHRLRAQGLDVLIGVVETHGRKETAALVDGLAMLPRRHSARHNHAEFDLDAALARHPAVMLIDELAHSNAAGSRHPKRWQDVEELLAAGMDVMTTVNVQHLESLNDVVSGITGVRVRETVPDPFFDSADEIVLVDLPPDDLLQRLKEGKVYVGDRAERAIENFFRKGNLFALRELALRRTADRVDDQMRLWRDSHGRAKVWHTRDAILLCIGDNNGSEKLVRIAARLAAKLGSDWHAVYVETPRLYGISEARRRAVLSTLQLARELGAETATLSDPSETEAILRYAREHNLGKIVIGRSPGLHRWRRERFLRRLGQSGPELDLLVVALNDAPRTRSALTPVDRTFSAEKWRRQLYGCAAAALLCALITFLGRWLLPGVDSVNLVMIYLLGVVIVALRYGRWPSVIAAVLSVIAFDLTFIAPTGTLAVFDMQYLVTFGVMLTVGTLVGNLTAGVRYQARVARYREQRARRLYELAQSLGRALSQQDIASISQRTVESTLGARSELLLTGEQGELFMPGEQRLSVLPDQAIARWSIDKGQPAGAGTDTLPAVPWQMLPLKTAQQTYGLLIIEPNNPRQLMIPEQQQLVNTFTALIANALERLQLAQREEVARLAAEREQLRNALLSALSHDLRTPLTVLFSQAEILMLDLAGENSKHAVQASQIRQQTLNTVRLVNNLLDMARLQSGGFHLHTEWMALDELIGSALQNLTPLLGERQIQLDLPNEMLLLQVDGALMERVFANLLENALKYAGESAQIGITALRSENNTLAISVWDSGRGISPGQEGHIFEKFARGSKESAVPGVGLGLAICQAIIDIHGGTISASHRPEGGACFTFTLPLGAPPELT